MKTRITSRRTMMAALGGGVLASHLSGQAAQGSGIMMLLARSRSPRPDGVVAAREQPLLWKPAETAIIICDMWDNHYCQNSAKRVREMAPRMNRVITQA